MKRFLWMMTALVCALCMQAANYGILVNDTVYFAGTAIEPNEGYEQYLAHVQVKAGDKLQLCDPENDAQWVVPLNTYSVDGFTLGDKYYNATVTGCYDFYIQVKYMADRLYIGDGSNCGEGVPYQPVVPCPEAYGLMVGERYVAAGKNTQQTDYNEWMILGLHLDAGEYVQLYDTCSKGTWIVNLDPAGYQFTVEGSVPTGRWKVTETGSYDFYIKLIMGADEVYVSKDGAGPTPSSSVPSQCTDVLLQGFYYDSYKDNDAERGTDKYGNTRWKTLLEQSGEIGAYFDLIWLPPSALASGTGYHPRQYSNQNSDWGTRADLEKLIAAFHNSGTKVVADVVVNHLEAMSSWCDFAVQDFGKYGVFQPDGSWICNTDEMNMESCRKDAGECFGTATGPADDGPDYDGKNEANYAAARDLAHDKEEVREMCRAYAKWLINEMHYDGFRYDYCKGFHASHIGDYNRAGGAYISFMELWASVGAIQQAIGDAQGNTMSLDFPGKYDAFNNGIAAFNYMGCKGSGMLGAGMAKHAVTFVDNHDTFLRDANEFGGPGMSMTAELKDRLLQANAFMLGMPGVPCVFYPHWAKYKNEIKAMINARHLAGVHSESAVSDEMAEHDGYQCTVTGKNGYLILCLGNKAGNTFAGFTKVAYGNGYAMWVQRNGDVAPGLIVTPSQAFEDSINGINVTIEAVGGSGAATIYYTTDETDPTEASAQYTAPLNFTKTTTLKVMAMCGNAKTRVQVYTYTYREPLEEGIRVRFNKPDSWEKAYIYAWKEIITATDTTSEFILGAYPGARLYKDPEGWYSYEFNPELKEVKFQLSSGTDCGTLHVQSNNLEADYHVCYGWRDGKETESKEEEEIPCETQLNPEFDLVITPETGYFHDPAEGVNVTIYAVGASNAIIYYTTDGSEPTTTSSDAPEKVELKVSATTVVKAFAYNPSTKERTATYTERYAYKAPQEGPLTVKFIQPEDWTDLYIYAFTREKKGGKYVDTPYSLDGKPAKWPGIKWTQTEGVWHTYTMPAELKEIYVLFNAGLNKAQTQDIYVDENTCYLWNPSCKQAVVDANCDGEPDSPWEEGIEEILIKEKNNETYKLIINDRLVIVRDGVMYDVLGRKF